MNDEKDISSVLSGLIESLNTVNNTGVSDDTPKAEVISADSSKVDLNKAINDRIYGLITQDSLTTEQVALLSALLKTL